MANKFFSSKYIVLLFALCLTACGFRLRGDYHFPPQLQNVYVTSSAASDLPLVTDLRQSLANAHVTLSSTVDTADYILSIEKTTTDTNLQSSSTTGQINTYNLIYTVTFSLRSKAGDIILEGQNVHSTTQFTMGSNQLLTSFNQANNYVSELQQNAISQILFRLSSRNVQEKLTPATSMAS